MTTGENLFSNLLTITVLGVLALIIYLKLSGKTLVQFIRDMREAFSDRTHDVIEHVPTAFEDIR